MLGTSPGDASGIASLVQAYAAHGLFQRWDAVYLPTHRDGGHADKLAIASGAWLDVAARLAPGRVALLHIHLASYASFWRKALFMLPARLSACPTCSTCTAAPSTSSTSAAGAGARFIRARLRGAARVIALLAEQRDRSPRSSPTARVEVIPNPVDVPAWQASLEARRPRCSFLGMLRERKGVLDLLRAWPACVEAIPEAQLVLAGSGEIADVWRLIGELGIERSVRIEGWVEGEAKERLLRSAWVAALPSHVEALPMACWRRSPRASRWSRPAWAASRPRRAPAPGLSSYAGDVAELARALVDPRERASPKGHGARRARARPRGIFFRGRRPRIEALWRELAPAQEFRASVRAA
jgi:glycosyltransferase involved in cell wall biosynthesis